jgi:peptide/nickel transport system ATP-binding protein
LPNPGDLLRLFPHQLSGGMCQRVLIAMAFSSNPRLVIADEPTTALDVTMHPPILRTIAETQRTHGTAVIFITHDLRLAAQLCDDVVVMYAGRAIESGPARSVLAMPAHPYTRCLQLANPSMRAERRALYVLPDQMPSLRQLQNMPGCHFAPRCPLVVAACRQEEPSNIRIALGHDVACIRAPAAPKITATEQTAAAAGTSERIVLQVKRLEKRYAIGGGLFTGPSTVAALKNVSFSISENEFVALVGESGSGKSTVAKLLVGLEQPSSGRILFNGDDLTDPALRARAQRRELADGIPGSTIGTQSATAGGQYHHPSNGSRRPARELGGTDGAHQGAAGGSGFICRFRCAATRAIVRRAAPADQHWARTL